MRNRGRGDEYNIPNLKLDSPIARIVIRRNYVEITFRVADHEYEENKAVFNLMQDKYGVCNMTVGDVACSPEPKRRFHIFSHKPRTQIGHEKHIGVCRNDPDDVVLTLGTTYLSPSVFEALGLESEIPALEDSNQKQSCFHFWKTRKQAELSVNHHSKVSVP